MRITAWLSLMVVSLASLPVSAADSKSEADGWRALFDGKTLDGWIQRGGKANYSVEESQIVGRSAPNTPNSFLCTARTFTNFVLELEFKVHTNLNSGVQV